MSFPRCCSLRLQSVRPIARQLGIGEPPASDLTHCQRKAVSVIQRIVFSGAVVKAEHLLRNVAVKVERLKGNIGATQAAFQKTPEVFDTLRMNLPIHILFDMVLHGFVVILVVP